MNFYRVLQRQLRSDRKITSTIMNGNPKWSNPSCPRFSLLYWPYWSLLFCVSPFAWLYALCSHMNLSVLIAKKAHTIITLSALHDRIMTRYYKFLIVNVLVFFCVGTAALQSFLVTFKAASGREILEDVSDSFPTAGPFYVGWCKWSDTLMSQI